MVRTTAHQEYNGRYLKHVTEAEDILLMSILKNKRPKHDQRLFLVGRLWSFGYTKEDILDAIDKYNIWEGYNKHKTAQMIWFQCSHLDGSGRKSTLQTKPFSIPEPQISVDDLITLFWKDAKPVPKMTVSTDIRFAAWMYHQQGYHVVPKDAKGKFPSIPWKQYQDRQPTLGEMQKWDWTYGLCLIATKEICFLDIDKPYEGKWKGHYEMTPRGGVHVFGRGRSKSKAIDGVGEIKGYGTLIVSYPTEGYKI